MNPPIRTCYLFDEFGQQVGPFTVGETLRHLEMAEGNAPGRRRRLKVWTLGWPTRLEAEEARRLPVGVALVVEDLNHPPLLRG